LSRVLIGATEDPERELGIEFEPDAESSLAMA
jgi:hypothetical protein